MEKKDLIEKLSAELKSSNDFELIAKEVKNLKDAFVELLRKEHEDLKKIHDESGSTEAFKVPHDEYDGLFTELMTVFNQRKKGHDEKKAHELNDNLEIKRKIITDLKNLIQEEQHIGHAFEKFNELKEKWKQTGPVPNSDFRELQREYSHLIEMFFYNINIYKTLKEYDLQKNLQLKLELIEKVKALETNGSIKEVRDMINLYTHEWDEIGPTHQSEWEKVRDDFWEHVRNVHKKISEHFKQQKEIIKENFRIKENLCEKVEALASVDLNDIKQMNKARKEIQIIQEEWKKAGFAGKKINDELWARFKKSVQSFYDHIKEEREGMKEVFGQNEDKKMKVIERAEQLSDSMDWKNTAEIYKKLQSDWKRIGPSHPAREQKLWKKFRAASEKFFARRKDYFDNREEREKNNLEKKMEILQKLIDFKVAGEGNSLEEIQKIAKEWNAIGFVPKDEKQKIENEFQKFLFDKMKEAGLKAPEIESQTYVLKIEGFKVSNNADELLRKEYQNLDEKLRKIEADIKQYENNLGFFGGKTDNPLVKEVVQKIESSKNEVNKIKARLEMLEK